MQELDFKQAVEQYRDMVFRVAYTYMRDAADADDITQDVFVKLLKKQPKLGSEAHLRNWLVRVTINECKSLFRRAWRRVEDIEDYASTLSLPTREHGDVLVCLMRLPEKYRVPLVLRYYGGFSASEIAELLHVPAATVRTRLARGKERMKRLLEVDE